jgi:hypothetical protein
MPLKRTPFKVKQKPLNRTSTLKQSPQSLQGSKKGLKKTSTINSYTGLLKVYNDENRQIYKRYFESPIQLKKLLSNYEGKKCTCSVMFGENNPEMKNNQKK